MQIKKQIIWFSLALSQVISISLEKQSLKQFKNLLNLDLIT